jgi:hypothetical protein
MSDAGISETSGSYRHNLSIALAAVSCAVALAACGSSGQPAAATSSGYTQRLKFADCMRSHGVPNFPDPSPNGPTRIGPNSGINPQAPAFQSAQKACGELAPGGGGPPSMSESEKLAALAFAKCMRTHGQPDFPDPTLSAPSGAHLVLALRGMVFAIGPGVSPQSPAFARSAAACGLKLP